MLKYLFGNRGEDLTNLLESSLRLLGEGEALQPLINRLVLVTLNHIVLFMVVFGYYFGGFLTSAAIAAVGVVFLFPYSFFYNVKMRACQSWIAFAAITGKSATMADARVAAGEVSWSLRGLAFIELMIASRGTQSDDSRSGGMLSKLVGLLLDALEAVYDVAENYLLPTIVIEKKSIKDAIEKLKDLKTNIPATLTGAFGMDLFGSAVWTLAAPIHLFIFALGIAVGFLLAPHVPESMRTNIPEDIHHYVQFLPSIIFLGPVLFSFVFGHWLYSGMKTFISCMKAIYFSVFYASVNCPLEIRADLRDRVTHYLCRKDTSYVETVKQAMPPQFQKLAKGPTQAIPSGSDEMHVLKKLFSANILKGMSLDQIAEFARSKGYAAELVEEVKQHYNKPD